MKENRKNTKNKTIKTPFPYGKFQEYKRKVGIVSEKDIKLSKIKKLFLLAIDEFKKGLISSDDLSAISNKLFVYLLKDNLFKEDQELFGAIEAASEIDFYIRNPESKNLNRFLKEVLEYLRKEPKN